MTSSTLALISPAGNRDGQLIERKRVMVDKYTKWMLPIITAALVIIAANDIMHAALAQIGFSRVQVCDERNCAQLVPINVTIQGRIVSIWALPVFRSN